MRPHTRILYSLCDRITGEARGARQKDTGSNQARALHPTAQACAVRTPALLGYQGQSPLGWLDPGTFAGPHLKMRSTYLAEIQLELNALGLQRGRPQARNRIAALKTHEGRPSERAGP